MPSLLMRGSMVRIHQVSIFAENRDLSTSGGRAYGFEVKVACDRTGPKRRDTLVPAVGESIKSQFFLRKNLDLSKIQWICVWLRIHEEDPVGLRSAEQV